MAAFLSWLYSVAGRVYGWFGDQWALLYAGAYNAWTWAVSQATAAYNNAKAYAYNLFAGFQADLFGLSNWADYQIGLLKAQLANLPKVDPSSLLAWLTAQLAPITATINTLRSDANNLIDAAKQEVRAWVVARINDAINAVNSGLAWLTNIRPDLTALVDTLKGQDLANLITMVRKMYADLQAFLSDPVGWILDMLSQDLLAAIQYLLAWALGATNSELPSQPPWRK